MFQAIMESAGDAASDQPPPRPEGIHLNSEQLPTYSKMMATLVDQVKTKVDESKPADNEKFAAYIAEVKEHEAKIADLQKQLNEKLHELEVAETKKITSESYATGFDTSHVVKEKAPAPEPAKTTKKTEKVQAVEVLNPGALANQNTGGGSSGADADVDEPEGDSDDEADVETSPLARKFGEIKAGDYQSSLRFISQNPSVIAEKETDGLLVLGFNAQMDGKEDFARQCVHQALLLQYCRSLGKDGVGLFFKRITTPGHQAQKVFFDDVQSTYGRIKSRVKEILKEREHEGEGNGMVESIQLHAVEPGTAINIKVPPKEPKDEAEKHARELFEAFPPGLQRALESGSLDDVNKVLGKMSVEEAEEIVGQLGEVCSPRVSIGELMLTT
jgi:cell division cycle protein 37